MRHYSRKSAQCIGVNLCSRANEAEKLNGRNAIAIGVARARANLNRKGCARQAQRVQREGDISLPSAGGHERSSAIAIPPRCANAEAESFLSTPRRTGCGSSRSGWMAGLLCATIDAARRRASRVAGSLSLSSLSLSLSRILPLSPTWYPQTRGIRLREWAERERDNQNDSYLRKHSKRGYSASEVFELAPDIGLRALSAEYVFRLGIFV